MRIRLNLTQQILLGLGAGFVVGIAFPSLGVQVKFLSDLFLRLVQMIIVPLLLAVLVSGLSRGTDFKKVGRIALAGLVFFALFTVIVFLLGTLVGVLLKPGVTPAQSRAVGVQETLAEPPRPDLTEVVVNIVPTSVVDAMAKNDMLQLILFALFLGVAISRAGAEASLGRLFQELARVMFLVTDFVMRLAPVGVFAALAHALAQEGLEVFFALIRLVLVVWVGLAVLVFGVFFAIALAFRIPFWNFLRTLTTPFVLAFSTCSTMPALPRALEDMEKLGVAPEVTSFILPLGLRFNAVGSTLFQVVAIFFLIQYYRYALTSGEIVTLLLVLMVVSKGLAPVPRASLMVLAATLTAFHLPLDGIALILAVDQFMDMPRSGINVLGNCLASAMVARFTASADPAVPPVPAGFPRRSLQTGRRGR